MGLQNVKFFPFLFFFLLNLLEQKLFFYFSLLLNFWILFLFSILLAVSKKILPLLQWKSCFYSDTGVEIGGNVLVNLNNLVCWLWTLWCIFYVTLFDVIFRLFWAGVWTVLVLAWYKFFLAWFGLLWADLMQVISFLSHLSMTQSCCFFEN